MQHKLRAPSVAGQRLPETCYYADIEAFRKRKIIAWCTAGNSYQPDGPHAPQPCIANMQVRPQPSLGHRSAEKAITQVTSLPFCCSFTYDMLTTSTEKYNLHSRSQNIQVLEAAPGSPPAL